MVDEERLIGLWALDEGREQTAHDRSGCRHDGRIVGPEWAPAGGSVSAIELDGINDYLTVPHAADLNLADELSILAWVFPVDLAGEGGILVKGRSHPASGYMFLRQEGHLWFQAATERTPGPGALGTGYGPLRSGPVLREGVWQHVAVVYSALQDRAALFHNGVRVAEARADGRIVHREAALPLNLGAMSYPGHWNFRGFLRDVRLYSSALPDDRIREHHGRSAADVVRLIVAPKEEREATSLPGRIEVAIRDAGTDMPMNAKIVVRGETGQCYWPKGALVYGLGGDTQCFYGASSFELAVPEGQFEILATSGFEYLPVRETVRVTGAQPVRRTLAFQRLVDMPAKGWYGGEHHLHCLGHGGRRYDGRMTVRTVAQICRAEGMCYAFLMGSRGHDLFTTEPYPGRCLVDAGLGEVFECEGFVGQGSVEPIGFCGHRCVLGAPKWTVRRNPQFESMEIFDQVQAQGGVCIFSHPYAGGMALDQDPDLCFARELPVAVALGRALVWDMLCWGGSLDEKMRDWYRLLNLGFRLAVAGSTDCYMNNPAVLIAPGANRTYVRADRPDVASIVRAYREGRTVATDGPLLVFTVDGREIGERISFRGDRPERLRMCVEARHVHGVETVEIIRNGEVVAAIPGRGQKAIREDLDLEVRETCWLAARCRGVKGDCFGSFAHTSPIYVGFGSSPMKACAEDAAFFVKWFDAYRDVVIEFARRNSVAEEQYAPLLGRIAEAAEVMGQMTDRSNRADMGGSPDGSEAP